MELAQNIYKCYSREKKAQDVKEGYKKSSNTHIFFPLYDIKRE